MAYVKQTWTDNVTPVDGGRMSHIEDGLFNADANATTALARGSEVAYAEITAPSAAITANTEVGANTVITAPSFNADGVSRYKVEVFAPRLLAVASNCIFHVCLFDNGVSIGFIYESGTSDAGGRAGVLNASRVYVPAAGAHVYSMRVYMETNNGTVTAGPGGTGQYAPAYLRVTKVT